MGASVGESEEGDRALRRSGLRFIDEVEEARVPCCQTPTGKFRRTPRAAQPVRRSFFSRNTPRERTRRTGKPEEVAERFGAIAAERLGQEVGWHCLGRFVLDERPVALDLVAKEGQFDRVVFRALDMLAGLGIYDGERSLIVGAKRDRAVELGQEFVA